MKKIIQKYGQANTAISAVCILFFLLNSVLVSRDTLLTINDHITVAFVLNFLAGWEGILGKWGSMSYSGCFEKLQLWRVFTNIYLHVGVIHLAMNLAALLIIGKYVEKRLSTAVYTAVFHLIAVADVIIVSCFYRTSESVGASAGIFGIIGISVVMCLKKQLKFQRNEIIFLLVFALLSSVLGMESFVTHWLAFVLGLICGLGVIPNPKKELNNC